MHRSIIEELTRSAAQDRSCQFSLLSYYMYIINWNWSVVSRYEKMNFNFIQLSQISSLSSGRVLMDTRLTVILLNEDLHHIDVTSLPRNVDAALIIAWNSVIIWQQGMADYKVTYDSKMAMYMWFGTTSMEHGSTMHFI